MRLLLDESLPKKLRLKLVPHEVRTVPEMGWAGMKNGELLRLAEKEFDVFLTATSDYPASKTSRSFRIAVVILAATSNRLPDLEARRCPFRCWN